MFLKDSRSSSSTSTPVAYPSEAQGSRGVSSIISPDVKITGNLKSSGDIQVDGTIEGDVDCRQLIVGEGATVRGMITCEMVRVSGTIQGQIKAHSVNLDRTAKVTGDIFHGKLTIEEDAFFEGNVQRLATPAADQGGKVSPLKPRAVEKGPDGARTEGNRSYAGR